MAALGAPLGAVVWGSGGTGPAPGAAGSLLSGLAGDPEAAGVLEWLVVEEGPGPPVGAGLGAEAEGAGYPGVVELDADGRVPGRGDKDCVAAAGSR